MLRKEFHFPARPGHFFKPLYASFKRVGAQYLSLTYMQLVTSALRSFVVGFEFNI